MHIQLFIHIALTVVFVMVVCSFLVDVFIITSVFRSVQYPIYIIGNRFYLLRFQYSKCVFVCYPFKFKR